MIIMYTTRKAATTPKDFCFPYTPYPIQQQLMTALYEVLEQKAIGIFESPTGTGKSLTLTCAALRWLEDHEQLVRQDMLERIQEVQNDIKMLDAEAAQTNDWITAQFSASKQREELKELCNLRELLELNKARLSAIRERHIKNKRKQRTHQQYNNKKQLTANSINDSEVLSDNEEIEAKDKQEEAEPENSSHHDVQIFFCSRTHSQLAQVLHEVKRTAYGSRVRVVTLASRQQLCINEQVQRLSNLALINERCLDMARSKNKKSQEIENQQPNELKNKCSFKNAASMQNLTDAMLVDVMDIEDIVSEGKLQRACPYYAARAAAADAQLIFLSYQMLLHRRTREQSGINLRGAIIIIDEAHNLLDCIAQLHNCSLTLQQLQQAQAQISAYKLQYHKRFNTSNLLYINQLLFIIKRLIGMCVLKDKQQVVARVFETYQLMSEGDFFNIDLYKLLEFCERQHLAQKLQAFAKHQPKPKDVPVKPLDTAVRMLQRLQKQQQQKLATKDATNNIAVENKIDKDLTQKTSASAIRPLLAFLEALTEHAEDGRVLLHVEAEESKSGYKYVLLNPGRHFEQVVREARAIIVTGGTMQPTTELTTQLFASTPERVRQYFYDHVVPPDAVICFAVTRGSSGKKLRFSYEQRSDTQMLNELSGILQNLCSVVPAGLVCFLPSYDYLDAVYKHLQNSGILERIAAKKLILYESRAGAQSVEQLLTAYKTAVLKSGGALMLSVVGGKLSEGLNFADDLGRGVVVVGLPYPNRQCAELQLRMKYLDAHLGANSGNIYYENLCMKAVNQCIGRAVRHINDYATVFLLDERYAQECIRSKLPHWISRSLQVSDSFGPLQAATAKFFRQRKKL